MQHFASHSVKGEFQLFIPCNSVPGKGQDAGSKMKNEIVSKFMIQYSCQELYNFGPKMQRQRRRKQDSSTAFNSFRDGEMGSRPYKYADDPKGRQTGW